MYKITIIILLNLCIFNNAYSTNNEIAKNLCSSCHLFPNPEIMLRKIGIWSVSYLEHILGLKNLQNYSSDKKNEITEKWEN